MVKTAAVVILYYPEQLLEQNLKSYIDHVERVYVIDNTETKTYNNTLPLTDFQINYIPDDKNDGIQNS